ncbi:MAG TPA: outer membrane beta-barrel protein [Myxococcota bacterium]|nr:outer membrane beta-barrel protein [Myxococcota bacterium]
MEARISQLEGKVEADQKTIDDQAAMLKSQATPAVSQGTAPASALDAFLNTVQINGFVAASYQYSFNNPDNPLFANATNQFNVDHNTFSLDAAKIELYRPATNPGDAGFQLDLTYGANALILGGTRGSFSTGTMSNEGFYIQDMNVQYNWDNVLFKFGQWETLLGYEVIDSIANKNITHGLLFTYAIPLVHTGLQASGKIGESGMGWAGALVNGWNNSTDTNDNKGLLGQLNYANSDSSVSTYFSMYYGADGNTGFADPTSTALAVKRPSTAPAIVMDWNGTFVANEKLTFWANADWGIQKNVIYFAGPNAGKNLDPVWYGLALGSQWTFTDKLSLAVRGEWLRDTAGYRIVVGNNTSAYSLTGTLAYKLTTNLLARAEFRYDALTSDGFGDHLFPSDRTANTGLPNLSNNNYQGIAQIAYIFD